MFNSNEYPVLEFDSSMTAVINPDEEMANNKFETDKLIITFFPEVIEKLKNEGRVTLERTVAGENPLPVYKFTDDPGVLMILGTIGCPACGGILDMLTGMGIRKTMFCGGGGVLDKSIGVGTLLLVEGAIRDEGFSFQYIPASRVIDADREVNARIAAYLDKNGIPYIKGLTWTTDAIYRETPDRVKKRREEGAKIVEMEQSGNIAVTKFRGTKYGALIYGGDDVSGSDWDRREWRSRNGIRYDLVLLCKTLLNEI